MQINRFNIRVYGLLENNRNELLLVHERIGDIAFTKFPGGGLELGEGTIDGLKREFMEELGVAIEVKEHFYTTDFFQQSGFRANEQLVSIYYKVACLQSLDDISLDPIKVNNPNQEEVLQFFWQPKSTLHSGLVTFPIDKHVVDLILARQ